MDRRHDPDRIFEAHARLGEVPRAIGLLGQHHRRDASMRDVKPRLEGEWLGQAVQMKMRNPGQDAPLPK